MRLSKIDAAIFSLCLKLSNRSVGIVFAATSIEKSATMSRLSLVILLILSTLSNAFVPVTSRFAASVRSGITKQAMSVQMSRDGNDHLDADIVYKAYDSSGQRGDDTEVQVEEIEKRYDANEDKIERSNIESECEGKALLPPVSPPTGSPAVVEKKKKKKNLLSSEILRESTIVLSSADEAIIKKGSRRRGPNHGYALIRRTLLHYKMRYGDMLVPVRFSVPGENDDWPKEMWDMKLGKVVQSIRAGRRADKKEDLLSIGFCFGISNQNFENIKAALLTYKKLNNNLFIPRKFIVPSTEEYASELWGMKLGNAVSGIRTGVSCYLHKREELEKIGFCFDVIKERRRILELAVLCYSKKYNAGNCDLLISQNFIIPKTSDWPEETWGLNLGKAARNVRTGRSKSLDDLCSIDVGISFKRKKTIGYNEILETIILFYKKYGTKKVPRDYKVPGNIDFYPEKFWGVHLGSMVGRVRRGEKWPEKKEEFLTFFNNLSDPLL